MLNGHVHRVPREISIAGDYGQKNLQRLEFQSHLTERWKWLFFAPFQISPHAIVVSSAARTSDVFRLAGIAMATRIVPTEQMKAIARPSLAPRTNSSVQREVQMPHPSASTRPNCAMATTTVKTEPTKRTLVVSTNFFHSTGPGGYTISLGYHCTRRF